MCVGGSRPSPPPPDPAVEEQQQQRKAEETAKAKEQKQQALEQRVAGIRGGRGRRSLLTGTGGGMGYYNEYLS